MVAPDEGPWTFARTDLFLSLDFGKGLAYGDGLWVQVGRDMTEATPTYGVSVATDPAGEWTRKVTTTSAFYNPSGLLWLGGQTWVFISTAPALIFTDDNWETYSTINLAWGVQDVTYDGTYLIACSGDRIYYAASPFTSWSYVTRATVGFSTGDFYAVHWNGERLVVSVLAGVGNPTVATATSITGSWTVPATNVTHAGSSGISYTFRVHWMPEADQWAVTASRGGGHWYAPADASEWTKVTNPPFTTTYLLAHQDGYLVGLGRATSSTTEVTAYKATTTLAATAGSWTVHPNTWNTVGSQDAMRDLAWNDEVFVVAGKPSGQDYYGVAVSPPADDGSGWGVVLA